ncbi:HAD family hydrolase [Gluconobacter sp. Dm-62]|nr:HAD family hydrolase [Gluconobacter sp. Dm-62]
MDPESLGVAEKEFPQVLRRPAVFLDRDGVINRDFGWVGTRERFEWEAGAREAIARITESGYHVFIVTNQSGVARGFYSEDDLLQLMDWVIDVIRDDGGTVDDWRYCPMHPDAKIEQYRGSSINRKPAPGMIVDLLQRWELDPARCVLFGDQPSDMQAARAAGVRGVPIGPDSLADLVSEMDIFSI